jgi:hypothetical protein
MKKGGIMKSAARNASGLCLALIALAASAAQAKSCDRACLIKLTDSYLGAIAAHDPKAVPIAGNVRFVENVTRLKPGEGLWATATRGPTGFSIHVPDPVTQQAGWMGMLEQGGKPVIVAIRLKVEDGRIIEAEHLIAGVSGAANLEHLQVPREGLVTQLPKKARLPHDKLVAIGASYYDALDDNNGSLMPFASDCERHENGMVTAAPNLPPRDPPYPNINRDCKGQLDSNAMAYIKSIVNRRLFAADPVTGLAMGLSHFHHPLDNLPYPVTLKDGTKGSRDKDSVGRGPFDMPAAHIFKVGADGKVHEIEAMGFSAPFNSPSGWDD